MACLSGSSFSFNLLNFQDCRLNFCLRRSLINDTSVWKQLRDWYRSQTDEDKNPTFVNIKHLLEDVAYCESHVGLLVLPASWTSKVYTSEQVTQGKTGASSTDSFAWVCLMWGFLRGSQAYTHSHHPPNTPPHLIFIHFKLECQEHPLLSFMNRLLQPGNDPVSKSRVIWNKCLSKILEKTKLYCCHGPLFFVWDTRC